MRIDVKLGQSPKPKVPPAILLEVQEAGLQSTIVLSINEAVALLGGLTTALDMAANKAGPTLALPPGANGGLVVPRG